MIKRTSLTYINKLLSENPSWKILDIGCGYTAHDRATEVIETLMKHDIVQESVIDDKLIEEYGVRGRDSNRKEIRRGGNKPPSLRN